MSFAYTLDFRSVLCNLVHIHNTKLRFVKISILYLESGWIDPEDEGTKVLRNVGDLLQHCTAPQPKRRQLESSPPWKSQISHFWQYVINSRKRAIIEALMFSKLDLTPWSSVILDKLTVTQIVKKFPAFYWTPRFITVFTRARHWSLSLVSPHLPTQFPQDSF